MFNFIPNSLANFRGLSDAGFRRRLFVSLLVLIIYFPLFLFLQNEIRNVAIALAFLPGLTWAMLLGRWPGLVCGWLLLIPNYFILKAGGGLDPETALFDLFVAHAVLGAVCFIVGDMQSLRKRLAHELAERKVSEARFRSLFDHTNDAILILSMDMFIQDVNAQAARMLGYTVRELVGKNHYELVVQGEHEDVQEKLNQLIAGEELPIYERSYSRKDGSILRVEINAALIQDSQGNPHYIQSISRDITDRKAAEEKLYYQATHDELTGIYNRAMFFDLLGQAVERARRQKFLLAVLFLDLDGFKQANDTYGHAYGDKVLAESAVRIQGALRSSDTVARVGGDEFAVILEALVEPLEVEKLAARLRKALADPYVFGGKQATITASIGLAVFPEDGEDADVLVNSADQNMYKAKQALYASR